MWKFTGPHSERTNAFLLEYENGNKRVWVGSLYPKDDEEWAEDGFFTEKECQLIAKKMEQIMNQIEFNNLSLINQMFPEKRHVNRQNVTSRLDADLYKDLISFMEEFGFNKSQAINMLLRVGLDSIMETL